MPSGVVVVEEEEEGLDHPAQQSQPAGGRGGLSVVPAVPRQERSRRGPWHLRWWVEAPASSCRRGNANRAGVKLVVLGHGGRISGRLGQGGG